MTNFVWFPYAFRLLHGFVTKKFLTHKFALESSSDSKLREIQNQLSQILLESRANISLFEFREVLARYAVLTLAGQKTDENLHKKELELFRIALRQNIELGAKCLNRHNRLRLEYHQRLARRDFLQTILKLKVFAPDSENLKLLTIEFVEILSDLEARNALDEIFTETLQSASISIVQDLENEKWKPGEHKILPTNQIPVHLQALTKMAIYKKD